MKVLVALMIVLSLLGLLYVFNPVLMLLVCKWIGHDPKVFNVHTNAEGGTEQWAKCTRCPLLFHTMLPPSKKNLMS
jgi:hypothetical protein